MGRGGQNPPPPWVNKLEIHPTSCSLIESGVIRIDSLFPNSKIVRWEKNNKVSMQEPFTPLPIFIFIFNLYQKRLLSLLIVSKSTTHIGTYQGDKYITQTH